jgi:hypothetical protein
MNRRIALPLAALVTAAGVLFGISAPTQAATTVDATTVLTPPAPTRQDKPTKGVKAKKGKPSPVPPTPCGTCFMYAGDRWTAPVGDPGKDGAFTNMTVINPTLKTGTGADYHTLVELSVQSADSKQIIEVGFTKDPLVCGNSGTCVFVYHWVNGAETCYNGCNWIDYAPETTWYAGKDVTSLYGSYRRFLVQHSGGVWWIANTASDGSDGHWMGYFPGSLWTSPTFTKSFLIQRFGEVAATNQPTCTDMGYGVLPSSTAGASLGSFNTLVGSTWTLTAHTGTYQDTTNGYGEYDVSTSTIRYGGGGSPQAVGC